MIIRREVIECDITGERYDSPQAGLAYVAQGATGRWCEVLHAGPAELARVLAAKQEVLTYEEAHAKFERGEVDGWPEF